MCSLNSTACQEKTSAYLHTGQKEAVAKFNRVLLSALEVREKADLPCVVFCRLAEGQLRDIAVAQLDHADLIHGFHELYGVIDRYIANQADKTDGLRSVKWLKSGARFIAEEAFKVALEKLL